MPSRYEPRGNYTLLNSQRNETLTIIRNAGLNPLEFEWTNILTNNNNLISAISRKPTQFAFIFDTDLGAFIGRGTPGDGRSIDSKEFTSWNGLLAYFSEWFSLLKETKRDGVRPQRAVAQIKFFINQIVLNNKSLSNSDFNNWKNPNKY